ncbi:hypothetical protein [Bradyrhizobium sp. 145]|uniref:hypothetical protein n=1 Tax=Bradyrhizobium sp. 145 TaxID=2782621 RepID=UPI001FFBD33D|nr:hypothetical protein [Bradyrhizobium sp. 145]MCK1689005.1 hypothetical protein [Bradyrhizobium sp. 145]
MAKQFQNGHRALCYISYLRVLRERQGLQGLGIEAQRRAVRDYVARVGTPDALLAEDVEVESGKRNGRPELMRSFEARATLITANWIVYRATVHFLTGFERASIEFIACDLPNANPAYDYPRHRWPPSTPPGSPRCCSRPHRSRAPRRGGGRT